MSLPLRLVQQTAQPIDFVCPLCGSEHAAYIFGTSQFRIFRCGGCALTLSKRPLRGTAEPSPAPLASAARGERQYASLLASLSEAAPAGPVLVVADPEDDLVPVIEQRGFRVGRTVAHDAFAGADWGERYAAAVVSSALMRVPDPRAALAKIHRHLTPGAPLLLSLPLLDGRQAHQMGRNWHEWQAANLWYFTRETLNLLLLSANFERVWFQRERRGNGSSMVSAAAAEPKTETVVSIIVPVFNEGSTFKPMMDALLAKQIPGMRKEIIIVESNSTDGSRDLVMAYDGQPDVRIILQPAPRGKGNAVREGLTAATGQIVMIQDADLEYDLDDYDGLLAPVAAWQSMFILGSRHQGSWKMRTFADAPLTATIFNAGHWFFQTAVNVALGTRMSDPFTMFKVFRRDALYGIDFVCNRFDFDIELVIKLVRKGYIPVELPVNYTSRSFAEGKKVSFTRDATTWLWTIARARFTPIGRMPA